MAGEKKSGAGGKHKSGDDGCVKAAWRWAEHGFNERGDEQRGVRVCAEGEERWEQRGVRV